MRIGVVKSGLILMSRSEWTDLSECVVFLAQNTTLIRCPVQRDCPLFEGLVVAYRADIAPS